MSAPTIPGRTFVGCRQHKPANHPSCISCHVAIDWNCYGQRCHCGANPVGYHMWSATDADFFCDEHWTPLPRRNPRESARAYAERSRGA